MKANAPEKIYLEAIYPYNGVLPNGLNYNQSPNDIEYIRTDAFVKKACEVLAKIHKNYSTNALGTEYLINDFKKAMEM